MTLIRNDDLTQSIQDSLQYISYYHPPDFLEALHAAWQREESQPARDSMTQILANSRMCALGKRPLCQDTGIVNIFVKIGTSVHFEDGADLDAAINEGIRRAYSAEDNVLRKSILADPAGTRKNTGDNTPGVIHYEMVPGNTVEIDVASKGGGSEAKSMFAMLNPSDDLVAWVVDMIPRMGAGWCPPGMLGIGIGGTAERAMLMAKQSLMDPIDIFELQQRGPATRAEELRLEIFDRVNALGIGAQGLGGLTTVLDVKVQDYPCHAVNLPVALIPNCAATRHVHFTLDGSGVAELPVPSLADWPAVEYHAPEAARHVDLDHLTKADIADWKPGDTLLLSGDLLTGRDAAHRRICELLENGKPLPDGVDFTNKMIYYVGPVDAVRDEVIGPAGPTTATRMDKFTDTMLSKSGLIGMIGKAERGPDTTALIARHGAVYLIAVGGAAYLVSRAIREAKVIAFEDLGMEAIHQFRVEEMPVIVAVDSHGQSVHEEGPKAWRAENRIAATNV